MADLLTYGNRPKPPALRAEDIVPMEGIGPVLSDYLTTLGYGGNRAGRSETMARSIGMNPSFFVKYPALTGMLASGAGGAAGYGLAMGTTPEGLSPAQEKLYRSGLTFAGASLAGLLSGALRRHKMQAISRKFDEATEMNPSFRQAPAHHFLGGSHAAGRVAAIRKLLGVSEPALTSTQKIMYGAYNVPYVDMVTLPIMNAVEHVTSHAAAEKLHKPDLDTPESHSEFVEEENSTQPNEIDKTKRAAYIAGFAAALKRAYKV